MSVSEVFLRLPTDSACAPINQNLYTAVDPSCVQKKRHNNVFILWPYPQWPLFIFSYSVKVWCWIEFDSELMPYQPLLTFLCPRPKVSDYETATQFKWLMIFPLAWVFLFPQSPFSSLSLHPQAVLHPPWVRSVCSILRPLHFQLFLSMWNHEKHFHQHKAGRRVTHGE